MQSSRRSGFIIGLWYQRSFFDLLGVSESGQNRHGDVNISLHINFVHEGKKCVRVEELKHE